MSIGFTGTRHGMTAAQETALRDILIRARPFMPDAMSEIATFHHGCCVGSDEKAGEIARGIGYRIVGHPGPVGVLRATCAVDELCDPLPHLKRNSVIVCKTDGMLATPFEADEQQRGGTWWTIKHAIKLKKPITVILPDGSKRSFNCE